MEEEKSTAFEIGTATKILGAAALIGAGTGAAAAYFYKISYWKVMLAGAAVAMLITGAGMVSKPKEKAKQTE